MKWSRRQFLKAASLTGMAALSGGCSEATRKLIPFLNDAEDIVPGTATWYATTCRECPAGCGMLAKTRDGRVIKAEGNPLHPINAGKLCARGQASVQGVYNPDRYRAPSRRGPDGSLTPVSWEDAEREVSEALKGAIAWGKQGRVVFLTDLVTGSEAALIRRFLAAADSSSHLMYEPLHYEAIRAANRETFGSGTIPTYHIDHADFLITLSADFLETWVSNVQFTRQFTKFREVVKGERKRFVYVGPRLSLTAANADEWIPVPPGSQSIVALGLVRNLLERNQGSGLSDAVRAEIRDRVSGFTPDFVAARTGIGKQTMDRITARFMAAKRPLVLAEGTGYQDLFPLDTARAANVLNALVPASLDTIDFARPLALSRASTSSDIKSLIEQMAAGAVDVLFVSRANPVYHLPLSRGFAHAVKHVPLVVSFSSFPDETGQFAHLILPTHTFFESWGDFEPASGIKCLLQPVTGSLFNTRPLGDILLALGRALRGTESFPEKDFYEVVYRAWTKRDKTSEAAGKAETGWLEGLQKGGSWNNPATGRTLKGKRLLSVAVPFLRSSSAYREEETLSFVSYPTVQFFDGRMANRPFLQELPDPLTAVTWGGWVEMHPETAKRLNVQKGDVVALRSGSGTIHGPVYPYRGIVPGTVAVPMSHWHNAFGRYAHAAAVTARFSEGNGTSGAFDASPLVTVVKTGSVVPLAHTDGSDDQHGRDIARSLAVDSFRNAPPTRPDVVVPLPQAFDEKSDFYPPHTHDTYRWSMIVDLDRCIGCGACVVACYAENNVAVVGREQVLKGREMAWLHVQRYFEAEQPFVRFLPMMCQHCDEAPCESVCPVFAPQHSKEGLNNQVYNRCIGSRYCNQNCPYKVRRFNWLDWRHDPPLEWQLNPDLTVRTKGVMEKCSFCIQRIVEAKIRARSENRTVKDGEFTTACAQTCPADAITFGNLLDPNSRVSTLVADTRAYQVLGNLNTKPAVIYLKKITSRV
ncbi:MAG: Tetrathionate reductase subunit B precursor [Syntrophorhabdaceae bacterium PtaU1.Bin034]|nr:MAG: Tetrathionate reductase subunit B precursor [Syntrophorhabdaceae bacterium PtaU1.Bin034]